VFKLYLLGGLVTSGPAAVGAATDGLDLGTLAQTGTTGTLAAVLLLFARGAYLRAVEDAEHQRKRAEKAEARADRERVRADRAEARVEELNRAILDKYLTVMDRVRVSVAEATALLRRSGQR
jgi:hypothetical protein